jgi:uncharacterized membrane protein YdbT with pleckstrin-like domain
MSYVSRTLGPHERILYATGYHWLIWLGIVALIVPAPTFAVIALPYTADEYAYLLLGVVALPFGLLYFARAISTEIAVTTDRYIHKTGLISFDTEDVGLEMIETVIVEQSILGRLLGYGTLRVHGTGQNFIEVRMIDRPVRLRHQIQLAREGQQSREAAEATPASLQA